MTAPYRPQLVRYLEKEHSVQVRTARAASERGTLRRFDPDGSVLALSELLPTRSRKFQLALGRCAA